MPPSFSSQPQPPSSPGFRPGDSPGPGNNNYTASSDFGHPPSSRVYATPAHSHASYTPAQGSAVRGSSIGATPLPRADLGTKQRSSVRRQRPRGGQLPPVSPADPSLMAPPSSPFSVGGSEARRRRMGGYSPIPPSSAIGATPGRFSGFGSSSTGGGGGGGGGGGDGGGPPGSGVPPSDLPSEAYSQAGSQAGSELEQAVLWGTNIAVREAMRKFRRFLTEFRMEGDLEEESYYMRLLVEIRSTETYNINIDCQNLYNFLPTRRLYEQLVRYPQEIVPIMDLVVHQEYTNLFGQGKNSFWNFTK